MTTTWQILNSKRQKTNGLITKISYRCLVQLDNNIARKIGELELTGDPSSSDFIPYENLTEETLIEWVQSSLGSTEVTAIETALQNNVTALKEAKDAETELNGLPWRQ
jgi:hypothetical protein